MSPDFAPNLLSLAVHDLRNGLNSILLSAHLVKAGLPPGSIELRSDVDLLEASVRAAHRMVETLGAASKLKREHGTLQVERLPAARVLGDAVSAVPRRPGSAPPVELVIRPGTPAEVQLDPHLTQQALEFALRNALACTRAGAIRVISDGREGRWVIEIRSEEPPPPTDHPGDVEPGQSDHLVGSPGQRRALDLAIAAWVSRCFGGTARLEVTPGQGSCLVLDWPVRADAPAPAAHAIA